MKKYKREQMATECEVDAGAVIGGTLNEAGMARRSFLGRVARCSAAVAVVGLGPEAWMQAVFRRSVMSSAVASGATRNRQLHPFPEDDPFNMPLGVNAWYAPSTDPATSQIKTNGSDVITTEGQGAKAVWFTAESDPITRIYHRHGGNFLDIKRQWVSEYFINLQSDAVPSIPPPEFYGDRHLNALFGNMITEMYYFFRDGGDYSGQLSASARWAVQNHLDRYSFGFGNNSSEPAQNPLSNNGGTRAWGGSSLAGLIRRHEIDRPDPYIPHAIPLNLSHWHQIANAGKGPTDSPLYNFSFMFPADKTDAHGFTVSGQTSTGAARMGMRFGLDPSVCTDAWIEANAPKLEVNTRGHPAGAPNPWQIALAKALRDYGGIVVDSGPGRTQTEIEGLMPEDIQFALKWRPITGTEYEKQWRWLTNSGHIRRIATVINGNVIHRPLESHWDRWRASGEGWGGGAPRVPYSRPLSGELPPATPEAPGAIQVSAARILDGTE